MDDSTGWNGARPFSHVAPSLRRDSAPVAVVPMANATPVAAVENQATVDAAAALPPVRGSSSRSSHQPSRNKRAKPLYSHGPTARRRHTAVAHNDGLGDDEPEWTLNLDHLVTLFMDKCAKRILLHREAAHYYAWRLRCFSVPGAVLGALGASAVFANWKGELCDQPWHQYTLLGSGICMLLSTALGAYVSESQYAALYAAHVKSYRNFDTLLKKLTVELCFEPNWRQAVRGFIDNMIKDYDRFTDDAALVPRSVEKKVQAMLRDAHNRAQQDAEAGRWPNATATSNQAAMPVATSPATAAAWAAAPEQYGDVRRAQRRGDSSRLPSNRASSSGGAPPLAASTHGNSAAQAAVGRHDDACSNNKTNSNNKQDEHEQQQDDESPSAKAQAMFQRALKKASSARPTPAYMRHRRANVAAAAMENARRGSTTMTCLQKHCTEHIAPPINRTSVEYCQHMPFSALIEMGAPTSVVSFFQYAHCYGPKKHNLTFLWCRYEEQLSASRSQAEADYGYWSAQPPQERNNPNSVRAPPEDADDDAGADDAVKRQRALHKRKHHHQRRHQQAHDALVQSAVRQGMNDVTASHQSHSNATSTSTSSSSRMTPAASAPSTQTSSSQSPQPSPVAKT